MANPMNKHRWHLLFGFLALGLITLLVASPSAHASSDPTFAGQADSISGATSATPVTLPANGSAQQNSLATFNKTVSGFTISATNLQASTSLQSGTVHANASLEKLNVTVGSNTITADALTAESTGACTDGNATLNGSTTVTNLVVNGVSNPSSPVTLTGVGTLDIDFSFEEGTQTSAGREAIALHIVSTNQITDLIDFGFTSVHADCTAVPGSFPPTGGGPVAPTGDRTPWMLWGSLLALLGLTGLGGTLVMRRRGLR